MPIEARTDVLQTQGIGLDAVHEDDAHAGEGIVIQFADGLASHFAPSEFLFVQGAALGIEQASQGFHLCSSRLVSRQESL